MNNTSPAKEGTCRAPVSEPHSPTVPAAAKQGRARKRRSPFNQGPMGRFRGREAPEEVPPESARSGFPCPEVCAWKRSLDVSCVLLSLPLTLPLMAAVALWIKLISRGPAIFRQERIGRHGRRFTLYKFRSMHVNADGARHTRHFRHLVRANKPMVKLDLQCDSRLIPTGCLLRAAGLDELPQLWNILRGEMSLVGPRPCLPEEYRYFSRTQRVRFEMLPGLTGIWQTQGKELSTFSEMNQMDAHYVKHASPLLDLGIMLRTPLALLRQMRLAVRSRRTLQPAKAVTFERFGDAAFRSCGVLRLR
jgi:exopolysaccharide production protein ExoY